jgi:nitroreductase
VEFFEAVSKRRSIRDFETRPVEKAEIERIVDVARQAPTARNVQPWVFVAVTDVRQLKKIGTIASPNGALIIKAPLCLAVFCEDTKYYLEDGCAATTQALLAVAALGLGACWVAGDKNEYAETIREILGVPGTHKLVSLIAIGYPKESPHPSKKGLKDVLHREKFHFAT